MKNTLLVLIIVILSQTIKAQVPSYVPTNGLKAWYPFSDNANDISGSNLNGTVVGAALTNDRNDNANSAYSFTTNQQINIPNSASLNNYPITISLWYNASVFPTGAQTNIFSKYVSSSWNGYQILFGDNTNVSNNGGFENHGFGTQSWYVRNTSNKVIGYYGEPSFLQPNISLNTWYHYVFVLDSTGGKIYVNGQLVSSHNWTGTPGACINSYLWKIGGQYEGTTWFNGKIDDIGIWNRALSSTEIQQLYTSCSTSAPIGSTTQTLCSGSTIANLTATGTTVQWYSTSSGGTALASTTTLVSGTIYYASQTVNGCESTLRLAVTVSLNNPSITASATTVCAGQSTTLMASPGNSTSTNYSVGSIGPSGGYIFFDQGSVINGWRYLEAAPSNIQNSSWGCGDVNISGATSLAIGSGLTNTNAIVNTCKTPTIAAKRCLDYSLNGYDDWYLPSQNEFSQIYQNLILNNLGNFNVGAIPSRGTLYWTSSQLTAASGSHFCLECGGNFYQYSKIYELYVRPIRQFSSGTPFSTYLWSTGETTPTINPSPNQNTQYWVDVTTNGVTCRKEITVTVNSTTAPTGSTSQTLNTDATVANLTATGANIKWYATATGGTELALTAILVNGTTYYASQTVNVCESSARLAVTVSLNNPSTEPPTSVTIGSQVWTNKNLDIATYRDGTIIPHVTDPAQWANLTTGAWCYYNNDPVLGAIYGRLYNWYAVAGIWDEASKTDLSKRKQLAPKGWHVPTDSEWKTLTTFIGGVAAGGKMKETGTTHWNTPNTAADNSSGFTGLPGGGRSSSDGSFIFIGDGGYWWSSLQYSNGYVWNRTLYNNNSYLGSTSGPINSALSVRFLMDSTLTTTAPTGNTIQTLCSVATVANLTATGTAIKWYAASAGGTALANTTTLVNGTTYYASQTVNSVESTDRLAVSVSLNNPTVSASSTTVCIGQPTTLTASSDASTTSNFSVGSIGPSGGYVFYDQGSIMNGWRYLEAAPIDNGSNEGVGCYCASIPNTSTNIGNGLINTSNWISAGCNGYWFSLTQTLSINGFTNWFIPSKDELNLMYANLKQNNLGNFQNLQYWSSSPAPYGSCEINGGAWVQNFTNGTQNSEYRPGYQGAGNLRLVRQFSTEIPFSSYLWSTGATTASLSVSPTSTTQYWVDVTTNGVTCRKYITITVDSTTSAPTGSTSQTLCSGSTIDNLTATGTNIKWYSTSKGGTALASTIALVNGTTYYASQTVDGCESTTRLAVTVSLNNPVISSTASSVYLGGSVSLTASDLNNYQQINNQVAEFSNYSSNMIGISYNSQLIPTNNFSYDFWFNTNRTITLLSEKTGGVSVQAVNGQNFVVIPDFYNSPYYRGTGISVGTNGISVIEHCGNFFDARLTYSSTLIGWHHCAVVYQNNGFTLFLDGNLVGSRSNGNNFGGFGTQYSTMGLVQTIGKGYPEYDANDNYTGKLDEYRQWSTVLSSTQISQIYNRKLQSINMAECNLNLTFDQSKIDNSSSINSELSLSNPTLPSFSFDNSFQVGGFKGTSIFNISNTNLIGTNLSTYVWSTGQTSQTIDVIPPQTSQYWVDVTTNGITCRKYTTITVGSLDTEAFDKSGVSIYPNPTSSLLNVKVDTNIANEHYTISDALGKIVLKGKLNEGATSISVEQLSKGIYFIKLSDNNASKFIKE